MILRSTRCINSALLRPYINRPCRSFCLGAQDGAKHENLQRVRAEESLYKSYMRGSDAKDVLKEFLMRTPSAFQPMSQGLPQGGFRDYLESQGLAAGADPNAYKMFSSTTTFPMTIAFALESLFPADADLGEREEVSVLVLGARAESSLPPIWWRELLVAFSRVQTRVRVAMMGPDLQASPHLAHGPASVSWPLFQPSKSVQVSHVDGGRCTLHEHPDAVGLLRESDCIVLFNPGFGSDVLKESWKPTLSLLLASRKPVVCTAHSRFDLERDLAVLEQLAQDEDHQDLGEALVLLVPPAHNPFMSMHATVDEKEEWEAQAVTCNEYVYIFMAK